MREKRVQDATIDENGQLCEKREKDATDDKNRQLREKRVQDATIDENRQLCEKREQDATVDENRQLREKREKREQDVTVDSTLSDATEHDKIDISVQNHKNSLPDVANVYDFIDKGGNRTLKIVTLNICGVFSKLNFPEFFDFVNMFDVICLVETKLDPYDSFQVEGYDTFTYRRKSKKGVRCGGIAVLIKSELCKYVSFLEGGSSDAMWFINMIKRPLVKNDIICGAVYVSPEGSRYCSLDCFEFLEMDLMSFITKHENPEICLLGDFNARTSNLNDTLFIDENTIHNLNIDSEMLDCSFSQNTLSISDRVSYDKKINNYGYRLIELCKTFGINIVNGRYGMDKN